jgi:putative PIN family toxin of toxin-antitoxin system
MKIVLDANVIIAAFAAKGLCSDIFRFCIESAKVFCSKELLIECEKTLKKKIKLPSDKVEKLIIYLKNQMEILEPEIVDATYCRDKNDLHVLGIAKKSKANFIITGDNDLLVLKKFEKTKIYAPRQFWTYVQSLK